jgi:anthranilate phosphoribosyltransferase
VAAAGVPVAKHGNHGVSSKAGSADVLGALKVPYKLDPTSIATMVKEIGLGFIYAPAHHPLFAKIGPVRRALGFRTAFNLLGPLVNPAQVKRQVIGVPSIKTMHMLAEVLAELGTEKSMVLHTPGPYDEVSLTAPAKALLIEGRSITAQELAPQDFGTEAIHPQTIVGGDAEHNAARITAVFEGEESPLRNAICANAACAFLVADKVENVREGYSLAQDTIARGLAKAKLAQAQAFQGVRAC